ncbi:MAG TPA: hypothetical protein VJ692_14650, partial [Nitrospiraceae bacterium]|nr:hypothetical protein [Nitrospiraceae bacterium]
IILLMAALLLLRRPDVVIKDSPEFEKALRIWLPIIITKQHTPRSIKRFLNRVRYLAMLQRQPSETEKPWTAITAWMKKRAGFIEAVRLQKPTTEMAESILVALTAMHHSQVEERRPFMEADHGVDAQALEETTLLQRVIDEHDKAFSNWTDVDGCRDTFYGMLKGIRVS